MKKLTLRQSKSPLLLCAILCSMALTGCKSGNDTLNELRAELSQEGDTLIGYSLKKHYAMWIKAHDVRRLFKNPLKGTVVGLFDYAGAGFNENAEFTFTNATIIYTE